MPQDPNLYGQRPKKKQRRDATLSSSLEFTAQLTSLMASSGASSGSATAGRVRPSKEPKDDLFRSHTARKREAQASAKDEKLVLKDVAGTEEESRELARVRRNMECKARLYAAMKRGDYVPQDNEAGPLIDFDRKWAENEEGRELSELSSSSGDEQDGDGGDDEIIEYEDEFGRLRRGTRAEKERMERRARRGLLGAEELDRMSARPAAPSNLIHGDAIQAMAFAPDDPEQMEALARKRDRSATPPEMKHYDADREVRTKGVGFYKFSKDEEERQREMRELEAERRQTEEQRQAREDRKAARRREMEDRRKAMEARRATKQADSFLSGLDG
ncbi:hypothetical protein ISF_04832 [Cordyceps fumosorosea ARSEF 2679]|uniref:Uncharacterized protein n=1 Tax=Cordyceps fumosorosea (strain ARSEF 2679) TaxID=1081104 RepID=A0A167VT57_CORFA|nr:hypothetical protein ISF_04832 [Cordyceps fumosorosea ARSEF 2679]OAA62956.1 hypothetical protein ISF_04832 [Cordyceps fumosorosea ARSEF 2679]